MRVGIRFFCALLLGALAFDAYGQGSAAGFGQAGGGFGGGGGGYAGGRMGRRPGAPGGINNVTYDPSDNSLVIAPPQLDFWETKSMVLSPSDKVEWKIDAKAGQVLMATADSDAFDPAIVVEDPKGKAVLQNDDQEEGNQSPFVIYRFPTDGIFKVKVVSFRNNAGGKFTFRMRHFNAQDIKPGETKTPYTSLEPNRNNVHAYWNRYTAKKGEIIALQSMYYDNTGCGFQSIIGPTGTASDAVMLASPLSDAVFKAQRDGDYYIEWRGGVAGHELKTKISLVTQLTATVDQKLEVKLAPGERALIEVPMTVGVPVRSTLTYDKGAVSTAFYVPAKGGSNEARDGDEFGAWVNSDALAEFRFTNQNGDDQIRILKQAGNARVMIGNRSDKPQTFTLTNTTKLDQWANGPLTDGKLEIGESRYYLLDSSKSDLKKVWTKTSAFELQLDIFRMTGDRANTMVNMKTHSPSDDLYFPEAGKFLVRISCVGNGGSGAFQLRQDSVVPTAYTPDQPTLLKLTGDNFGLYAADLKQGWRYEVLVDDKDYQCAVDLVDDEGTFLVSQNITFGATRAFYFTPVRAGRHRLWIRGPVGEHKFVLRAHKAPEIGG